MKIDIEEVIQEINNRVVILAECEKLVVREELKAKLQISMTSLISLKMWLYEKKETKPKAGI